ncbi:MAG: hypothetical protein ACC651_16995, partial [Candidatus Scalindua sp.]
RKSLAPCACLAFRQGARGLRNAILIQPHRGAIINPIYNVHPSVAIGLPTAMHNRYHILLVMFDIHLETIVLYDVLPELKYMFLPRQLVFYESKNLHISRIGGTNRTFDIVSPLFLSLPDRP